MLLDGPVTMIFRTRLICGLAFIALSFLRATALRSWLPLAWTVLAVSVGLCAFLATLLGRLGIRCSRYGSVDIE